MSGEEAADIGLATAVKDDPLVAAMELATTIAGKSPDAIRSAKQLFEQSWLDTEAGGLQREAKLQLGLMGGANQQESLFANMQKRAPVFKDAT